MKNIIKAFCLTFVLSAVCFGQTTTDDEYKKNEFYVGYTNQQGDGFRNRTSHGVQAAYTRNVSRFVGIKGDFSAAFQRDTFRGSFTNPNGTTETFSFENRNSRYTFLGGIQIKDNASKARFKPFVHALAGVAVSRLNFPVPTLVCNGNLCTSSGTNRVSFNQTNFSAALGGGLDIKINDRVDFRAFQVDYNPIFDSGSRQNNIRIGVGFVIK